MAWLLGQQVGESCLGRELGLQTVATRTHARRATSVSFTCRTPFTSSLEFSKLGHPQGKGLGLANSHDLAGLRKSRAAGRGWRSGASPGYLTPVWSPRAPDAPAPPSSRLPALLPALPARPTLRPALASRTGTGRRARGAESGPRWPLPSRPLPRPPRIARPECDAAARVRTPAPDSPGTDGRLWTPAGGMDSDSGEQSEGEPGTAAGPDVFSSKNLALQAQKKILSKIASKTVANMLIDDTSSEIFDELYKVTKEHIHNKKEAHKIMKDLIKVAIKIGILYRNNQFSPEEVVIVEKFRKKLNQTAMTIVSFYEVEYTFDRNVLSKLLHECKDLVHELVQRHLTPRTHGRINHVFNHFADVEFLSTLYSLDGDCRPNLKKICEGINKLIDEKVL
ncbi:hypothetical protein R6Z07M_008484 [Ovis aries]